MGHRPLSTPARETTGTVRRNIAITEPAGAPSVPCDDCANDKPKLRSLSPDGKMSAQWTSAPRRTRLHLRRPRPAGRSSFRNEAPRAAAARHDGENGVIGLLVEGKIELFLPPWQASGLDLADKGPVP